MRFRSGLLLSSFLILSMSPAFAADPAYVQAGVVVRAADADAAKSGIPGIASHVPDLEKALADGAADFPPKPSGNGQMVMLTDGPAEALMAMMTAANQKQGSVAIQNPYPEAGLLLAVYYNEVGKPDDVLRIVNITLQREPVAGMNIGAHMPALFQEQGVAFAALKRWEESLAAGDAELKAANSDKDKSRAQRLRGYALIELKRLDDAQAAYTESLKLEPSNPTALNEMTYINKLRAGTNQPAGVASGDKPAL